MVQAAGTGTVLALLNHPAHLRDTGLSEAMFDAVTASILTTSRPATDTTANAPAITFVTIISDLPALTGAERTLMTEWITRSPTRLRPGKTPSPVGISDSPAAQ